MDMNKAQGFIHIFYSFWLSLKGVRNMAVEFYKCNVCGNVLAVITNGGGTSLKIGRASCRERV